MRSRLDSQAWLALGCVVVWGALVGVMVLIERATGQTLPTCTFKRITGLPCPSCGSTRATLALAHGRLLDALAWNPLFVLIVPALVVALLVRGRGRSRTGSFRGGAWAAAGVVLLLIGANWVYVLWHRN